MSHGDVYTNASPQTATLVSRDGGSTDLSDRYDQLRTVASAKGAEAEEASRKAKEAKAAAAKRAAEAASAGRAVKAAEANVGKAEARLKAAETALEKNPPTPEMRLRHRSRPHSRSQKALR